MLTVGHRGASALAPENTLLAVRLAISYRLDFVEVDVHLSRDSELIVHHDAECTTGDGSVVPVAALRAAELARVRKGRGQVVPRLEEVLAVAGSRIGIYVELKAAGTPAALGALVSRIARVPQLIVGSFSPTLVAEARRAAPGIPRSVLFSRSSASRMVQVCRAVDAAYAHPCRRPITRALIDHLHSAGLQVMTPHTNDPAEAERFREAGTDVIASDDPRLLIALMRHPASGTDGARA